MMDLRRRRRQDHTKIKLTQLIRASQEAHTPATEVCIQNFDSPPWSTNERQTTLVKAAPQTVLQNDVSGEARERISVVP